MKNVCMDACLYLFRHHKKMFEIQIEIMGVLETAL